MAAYKLKTDLTQKIKYLRDRVAELKKDSENHQKKIEQNNKVLDCIEQNLLQFERAPASQFEPEQP